MPGCISVQTCQIKPNNAEIGFTSIFVCLNHVNICSRYLLWGPGRKGYVNNYIVRATQSCNCSN